MNQPLIKATLLHFLEWKNKVSLIEPMRLETDDDDIVDMYLREHPVPDFMEFNYLNDLWSDPKNDYELGMRQGICEAWKVVKGE